jgi:tRNA-2-methylthio-N6-dimethylallyladenosine synthase
VTLLGQNVDSYKWSEEENNKARLEKKVPMAL